MGFSGASAAFAARRIQPGTSRSDGTGAVAGSAGVLLTVRSGDSRRVRAIGAAADLLDLHRRVHESGSVCIPGRDIIREEISGGLSDCPTTDKAQSVASGRRIGSAGGERSYRERAEGRLSGFTERVDQARWVEMFEGETARQ